MLQSVWQPVFSSGCVALLALYLRELWVPGLYSLKIQWTSSCKPAIIGLQRHIQCFCRDGLNCDIQVMVTDSPLTSAFISMNSPSSSFEASTRICRPTERYLRCGDTPPEKCLMKYCPLSQCRRRYLTIGIAHNGPSPVCMWAS